MQVKEIMSREVELVRPDNTLQEAADRMRELGVGPLPVCDGERLVGIVTDRDITVRATAEGYDPWTEKVRDVMTKAVCYCFADQDVSEAERIMDENEVRRLVVVDRDKKLVGILSRQDLPGHKE